MKIFIFFLMLLGPVIIFSQELKLNKKIKSTTDFEHSISGISVPMNLGSFSRTALFTNSKNDSVFSAEYKNENSDATFQFKIVLGGLDEERLFNYYFENLKGRRYGPKEAINKTISFKDGNFKLNGISTYFSHLDRLINVRVYDAGFWIFVSETSQKGNDTLALDNRQDEFLKKIMPSKIVEKNPLTRYSNIYYAKACFRDSLMLRSAMSSATNKMKWIYENVNKYERASGIPGILLNYQIAGINSFIDYKTEKNPKPSKGGYETNNLIGFFTKLRESGFIDEFLMESYYYLLVPPENHQFDYKGYQKWKQENSIEYNTSQKYYLIVNSRKKTDLNKDE
ncbi:hypothetical protein OMO38_13680 [Chryseobacterium sp. 09-1422]|uniref:YARHG domain-containing protein n=1 Tax=Chryseobacterium kimseyorum TaxID=2984028 RepID=A0ABT3I0K8_9FLAO|nr:hypothetical protein [Chryseobacterium kimseyorum]MCW3169571.1 hypothetical protein [Chryseobacterium kimseyorum]